MTSQEVNQLKHGLYVIHWKSGGSSLAAIGSQENGRRWMACCNWVHTTEGYGDSQNEQIWEMIQKVGLITS